MTHFIVLTIQHHSEFLKNVVETWKIVEGTRLPFRKVSQLTDSQ